MKPQESIVIDGGQGEGGGQILRNALALSLWTQRPFRIEKIRAGRNKPGLLRQHLTAVKAAAEIGAAQVRGAELGSTTLEFEPGPVRAGDYVFKIGSAGSCTLVLQTVLLPLLRGERESSVTVEGGTHNPAAPPFDFLARTWAPLLRRMGVELELVLERPGFYPAGGGRVVARVKPLTEWKKLELLTRGERIRTTPRAQVCGISASIAVRELETLCDGLSLDPKQFHPETLTDGIGPGNVVMVELEYPELTEIVTAFGEAQVRAEQVARQALKEVRRLFASPAPVGEHLADQLLLPMALAGQGAFRALPLSSHSQTAIEVIRLFLGECFQVTREAPTHCRVETRRVRGA